MGPVARVGYVAATILTSWAASPWVCAKPPLALSRTAQRLTLLDGRHSALEDLESSGKRKKSLIGALLARGGAVDASPAEDEEGASEDDQAEGTEDDAELKLAEKEAAKISKAPVTVIAFTNWMAKPAENDKHDDDDDDDSLETVNTIFDHRVEISATRTKDVLFLKNAIAKKLPGKPPAMIFDLLYDGEVLDDDEMLLDEIIEDDENHDQSKGKDGDDDVSKTIFVQLNIIPPVEDKFGMELMRRIHASVDSKDRVSTKELVDAYCLNQVAANRMGSLLSDPKVTASSSSSIRSQAQAEAELLQRVFREANNIPDDVWEKKVEREKETLAAKKGIQRKGQRIRKGTIKPAASWKQSLQYNLNINWGDSIKYSIMFFLFGRFGGRNSFSRTMLLWSAPMVFIIQYRPVKLCIKYLFYRYCMHPPSILKSLLPAPQQEILGFDYDESYRTLYLTAAQRADEDRNAKEAIKQALAGGTTEEPVEEEEEFFSAEEPEGEEYDVYDDEASDDEE